MPAIPVKERWWKTKPSKGYDRSWYFLGADVLPLNAAWIGMESMNHLYKTEAVNWSFLAPNDPTICEMLGICPICAQWDHAGADKPIDIPLMPTNKKGEVSPHYYRHAWIFKPFGTPITVIHRKLFDIVSDDFDEDILVGDVYIHGGDRVPDLLSLIDRSPLNGRSQYRKSRFNYPGMDNFLKPCHHCGRDTTHRTTAPGYIYTDEYAGKSPRVAGASLLVSQETYARARFTDNDEWKKLTVDRIPESDRLLDPFPFPNQIMWNDMVQAFRDRGVPFPARKLNIPRQEKPGPWVQEQIKIHGEDEILIDRSKPHGSIAPMTLETAMFYLRVRALFEPKVAERIDNWDDDQLRQFIIEYHEATDGRVGLFPI